MDAWFCPSLKKMQLGNFEPIVSKAVCTESVTEPPERLQRTYLVCNVAGGKDQRGRLLMEICKLSFQFDMELSRPTDIARSTCPGTTLNTRLSETLNNGDDKDFLLTHLVDCVHHSLQNTRMLPHS